MITAITIMVAAFLNAIMDTVESEVIWGSKFIKLKERPIFNNFIYKRESWKHAKKIFSWKADLWHICKSGMILCIVIAIITYEPVFKWWMDFAWASLLWVITFNISYNKILKL